MEPQPQEQPPIDPLENLRKLFVTIVSLLLIAFPVIVGFAVVIIVVLVLLFYVVFPSFF